MKKHKIFAESGRKVYEKMEHITGGGNACADGMRQTGSGNRYADGKGNGE